MKKIYINGRFLTQNITGVQRYAIEIVKVLDKYLNDNRLNDEYKFEIVCPKNIKQKLVLRNINIKQIGKLKGHLWEQIELPLYVKDKFLFNFCNCAPLIKKNQIVVIHDAAVSAMPDSYSFLFKVWYKFMFYILGQRLNKIFTVSNFSKRELNKYFSIDLNKIEVAYSAYDHIINIRPDESIFQKINIKKKNYVLAVSSLNPSKNFKLILETAKSMPEVNFIIAGGSNSNVFKAQGFKITKNMKFIGYVTDEELVALYKYACCFVYPSLYEGFGIPILDAQIMEVPIICSDIPVFREVAGDGALFSIPDCEHFSLKLKNLLDNKSLREILKNRGRDNVKRFQIPIVKRQLEVIIK